MTRDVIIAKYLYIGKNKIGLMRKFHTGDGIKKVRIGPPSHSMRKATQCFGGLRPPYVYGSHITSGGFYPPKLKAEKL